MVAARSTNCGELECRKCPLAAAAELLAASAGAEVRSAAPPHRHSPLPLLAESRTGAVAAADRLPPQDCCCFCGLPEDPSVPGELAVLLCGALPPAYAPSGGPAPSILFHEACAGYSCVALPPACWCC